MHAGGCKYPQVEAEPVPAPAAAVDESIESDDEFEMVYDQNGRGLKLY